MGKNSVQKGMVTQPECFMEVSWMFHGCFMEVSWDTNREIMGAPQGYPAIMGIDMHVPMEVGCLVAYRAGF